MIDSVRGIIQDMGSDSITLEVGGIGLRLEVPTSILEAAPGIGKAYYLYSKLIVREDSLALYGFESRDQRTLFNTLLKVSGIGPRIGLAILSTLSAGDLQSAVVNNQPEILVQVPGIGKKTAERIIFHLKDRMTEPIAALKIVNEADGEVIAALTGLGYTISEAQAAMRSLPKDAADEIQVRIRLALQYFSQS
ncbi:MAG: Holliday junction branch migration protein RuvA [Chloroflexi bacterium]|nr:Holliday junction branch migration protein RuvA [Chloroflexota bacterium]